MTEKALSNYIKLKADDNIISPVCSESVESLDAKLRYFLESTNKTNIFEISRLRFAPLEMTKERALNDIGPRQWRGPIGLLRPLPELPGPYGLKFGVDLTAVHHIVQGEEVVMPFEVAAFIHPLDKRALAGK